MKKLMLMAVVIGAAVVFVAGCGKKEEPAGALDNLKKSTSAVATDAKAAADDAKIAADKAAADAKAAADKAAADVKK